MSIMLLLCQEFPLAMWGAHILETLRPNWSNPSETQKVLMTQYEWFIVLLPGSLWGVLFFAAIVVAIVGNLTKTSRYVMLMWAMTVLASFFGMAEVVRSTGACIYQSFVEVEQEMTLDGSP